MNFNRIKRPIAMLLALVMIFGTFPTQTFAADEKASYMFDSITLSDGTAITDITAGTLAVSGKNYTLYTVTVPGGTESVQLNDSKLVAGESMNLTGSQYTTMTGEKDWDLYEAIESESSPHTISTYIGEHLAWIMHEDSGWSNPAEDKAYFLKFAVTASAAPIITTDVDTTPVKYEMNATNATPLSVTATGTALTYQWLKSTTSKSDGFAEISGATQNTFTPPTNSVGTAYYKVAITNTDADKGGTTIESAVATVEISAPAGTVGITLKFAPKDAIFKLKNAGQDVTLPDRTKIGSYGAYENAYIAPATYAYEAFDEETSALIGSGSIVVEDKADQTFVFRELEIYAKNANWKSGTDFDVTVTTNGENPITMTPGAPQKYGSSYEAIPYMLPAGVKYDYTITPSDARKAEGYISALSNSIDLTESAYSTSASGELNKTNSVKFTIPNGAALAVYEQGSAYALATPIVPTSELTYSLVNGTTYIYRVSSENKVTYTNTIKMADSYSSDGISITAEQLEAGGNTPTTTVRDLTKNDGYNVSDIFLNINPQGYINLANGATNQIMPMRNWQIASATSQSASFIEPDFHYTVIDESGSASNIVSIDEKGLMTANSNGTAIVLVTYDAITADSSITKDKFFGAIWPENTGVFVVSVGSLEAVETGMKIHEDSENNKKNKLAKDLIDAELDVFYYSDDGAEYTFTPQADSVVTLLRPNVTDSAMTFSGGFSASGVKDNQDGSFTLDLINGRNIVKVTNGAKVSYQVLTAKKQDAPTIANLTNPGMPIQPGDKIKVTLDTVYLPVNRMTGLYDFTARINYKGSDKNAYTGTSTNYSTKFKFQATKSAREFELTIPKDWDVKTPFTLTQGSIETVAGNGGMALGSHRLITADGLITEKAVSRPALLGTLADISIPVQATKLYEVAFDIKDESNAAVDGYTAIFKKDGAEDLKFNFGDKIELPYGDYTYTIHKLGSFATIGKISITSSSPEKQTISHTLKKSSDGAWDGLSRTEPQKTDGVYQIGTGSELAWFADTLNGGKDKTLNAKMTANIDLAGYELMPIGENGFNGTFDGNNFSISNICVTDKSYGMPSFFGNLYSKSEIKNLTIESGKVYGIGGYYMGGLAAQSYGKITSCSFNADVELNIGSISSLYGAGGIVGYASSAQISDCHFGGKLKVNVGSSDMENPIGGIAGTIFKSNSSITNSSNSGSIEVIGKGSGNIGGIAGRASDTAVINSCFSTGAITARENIGGIVGKSANANISDVYNTADIIGEKTVGGLIGTQDKNSTLSSAYNSGSIKGDESGAVIGLASGKIEKAYYFAGLSGGALGIGASSTTKDKPTPKTIAELKALSSQDLSSKFTADAANKNGGYPILLFQANVSAIKIVKNPTRLDYTEGNTIDLTGMVVEGTVDGRQIALDNSMMEVSPKKLTSVGETEITISYQSFTAKFKVNVSAYTPPAPETISIETTLEDGLSTKSSRLTFDVIAKDSAGYKIDKENVSVKLNGAAVKYNWDDSTKTSFTLSFKKEGENKVEITALTKTVTYTINYTKAKPGDVIGQITVAVEALTIGGGYIIEPTNVDIIEGENGAKLITDLLIQNGFEYNNTGLIEKGFYLATITDDKLSKIPTDKSGIPTVLRDLLDKKGVSIGSRSANSLGEFDYTSGSGWMYAVNNVFPNVGFSDCWPIDGQVMRVQFTLALGADLGGGYSLGAGQTTDYYPTANKDALTKIIAEKGVSDIPKSALATMMKLNATQTEVDSAIELIVSGKSDSDTPIKIETNIKDATADFETKTVNGEKVSVGFEQKGDKISIVVKAGNKELDSLDGGIKVKIPSANASSSTVAVLIKPDGTREIIKKSVAQGGSMIIPLDGSAVIQIMDNGKKFDDVDKDFWGKDAVTFASAHELFSGVSKKEFAPNTAMSRGMMVTVLHRLENAPKGAKIDFADVAQDAYYANAVSWAAEKKIVSGTGNGFEPNGDMTREQLAAIIYRYAQALNLNTKTDSSNKHFNDIGNVSAWAKDAMAFCIDSGLISGKGNNMLAPNDICTRVETAIVLQRFISQIA